MGPSSAIQLSFNLQTSPQCKTVHLLGSWDLYQGQLPLSRDSSRDGGWKGTFRFQGTTLQRGQRYWYYYIIDGYHVSHDPTQESTTEPTTCRTLNILDVPNSGSSSSSRSFSGPRLDTNVANARYKSGKIQPEESPMRKRYSRNTPADIPLGRPVSRSAIVSPTPKKPNAAAYLTSDDFIAEDTINQLAKQFARYANVSPSSSTSSHSGSSSFSDSSSDIDSDCSSTPPSLAHSPISPASSFGPFSSACSESPSYTHALRQPKSSSRASASSGSSRSASISSSRSTSHRRPSTTSSRTATSSNSSRRSSPTTSPRTCSCERFGITRKGGRVRLDCGGARCGAGADAACNSSDDDSSLLCDSPPLLSAGSALGLIGLGDVSEKFGVDLTSLPRGDRRGVVVRRRR